MNSSIYIDGLALYAFIALILLFSFFFAYVVKAYISDLQKLAKLECENKRLYHRLQLEHDKLFKLTLATEEIKDNEDR